ncbi:unnamed protein product [Sphenostylis stenocarpa]|uniref:Fe2OG dioxygenase domain-containing protein n=1 Tax=Sphenostylis stenocarpa TaxID=92480 RepID=A0AA86VH33_9FABA|nr:unnamed protein product [Sphenostylis stenocarpa]
MDVAGNSIAGASKTYERLQELKSFDESKAGVKGLVDSGITKLPRFFTRPPEDLAAGDPASRRRTSEASPETAPGLWLVLEETLAAAREFHELAQEVKGEYYSRELMKKVKYVSNFDLYKSKYANWRDTLFCVMGPEHLHPQELPPICSSIAALTWDVTMEYSRQVHVLGRVLFGLLSEALGLNPEHLEAMDCAKGHSILFHYYPARPEPELTMGTTRHSDPDFLTILLQDHIGGLQVSSHNGWVDVPPVPGALVVNIGDLLQVFFSSSLLILDE